jgi:hypothetical protein
MSQTDFWRASLNPSSPRYLEWRKIFDSDDIEITSPFPINATLGNERDKIHAIDINALDQDTYDRLIAYMAAKFKTPKELMDQAVQKDSHFPIRASDVVISFSPRAFI